MNDSNLIPFSQKSVSEARECGAKGGINSGIARRKKAELKRRVELFASLPMRVGHMVEISEDTNIPIEELKGMNLSAEDRVIYKLIHEITGETLNLSAMDMYFKLRGGYNEIKGSVSQDQYNTMIFINQSAKNVVDEHIKDIKEIADKHSITLKPKEEYYTPTTIVTANPNDTKV